MLEPRDRLVIEQQLQTLKPLCFSLYVSPELGRKLLACHDESSEQVQLLWQRMRDDADWRFFFLLFILESDGELLC